VKAYDPTKLFLIGLLSGVVWLTSGTGAWGQSDHTAKLIEGAKKEGKLAWYTSMSVADSRPLLNAFERKYPFVKSEVFQASGDRIVNRILTENRAGRQHFDVVATGEIKVHTLVRHKLIAPYVSPQAKAYGDQFKDPAGYWTGVYNVYYVIGYNTQQISHAEAPKVWEDLLDPKWKDKIAIDRDETTWYATLIAAWGKERTQKYMKALAAQGIRWHRGHTLIAQLMAAGEFPLGIVFAHRIEDLKKKGAPLEWVDTLNPIVAVVVGMGLNAKPNNPNTAKLFMDFVLSKKGQTMIRSFNRIPARSDVEPLSPKMDQTKIKLKVLPLHMATRHNQYVKEFSQIFGQYQ